jgi:hypothetical protein
MKYTRINRSRNLAVIVTIAAMVVLVAIIISLAFEFDIVENLVMGWILTTFYSIIAFWLVGNPIKIVEVKKPFYVNNEVIKEVPIQIPIENKTIEVVEKPVEIIKEVPIQIPIENRTIELVDHQVIKRVEVPVYKRVEVPIVHTVEIPVYKRIEKNVYIKPKKLNIPKFNYLGSSETKTFHKRSCRLGKLIKRKYKVHNNSSAWFAKKHFKACKVCMKNKK